MGSFSPIHWILLLPVLLLFVIGPLVLLFYLLANRKTRMVTIFVLLTAPIVFFVIAVVVDKLSIQRNDSAVATVAAIQARNREAYSDSVHRVTLGDISATKGRIDEAIEEYLKALEIRTSANMTGDDDGEIHRKLASVLATKGRIDDAIEHYKKALHTYPFPRAAREALDKLLQQQAAGMTVLADAVESTTEAKVADTNESKKDEPTAEVAKNVAAEKEEPIEPPVQEPDRPAWVDAGPRLVGDVYEMAVTAGPFMTLAECEANLASAVQDAIARYAETCLGPEIRGKAPLPDRDFWRQLVKQRWQEVKQFSVGPMTQLHALVQFDRKAKDRILDCYKQGVINDRLRLTGLGLTACLALLAGVFGYLKLTTSPPKHDEQFTPPSTSDDAGK